MNLLPIIKVEYLRNYLIYKNKVRITIDHRPTYEMKYGSHISKKKDSNIIVEYKFDEIDYDIAANLIKESYFNPKRFRDSQGRIMVNFDDVANQRRVKKEHFFIEKKTSQEEGFETIRKQEVDTDGITF